MAFVKKTWKNRVSEFFNRYRVENVQTGAISKVYMNLDDGVVTQEGDVIDADTMNDLENRIENALADVGKGSNWVGTTEEWKSLTDEEKAEYDTYDLTDDFEGYGVDNTLVAGSGKVITSGGVANHLVSGDKKFYFDYQDGKYGYNTSANRGADTFVPFNIYHTGSFNPINGTLTIDMGFTPSEFISAFGLRSDGEARACSAIKNSSNVWKIASSSSGWMINSVSGSTFSFKWDSATSLPTVYWIAK